MTTNATNLKPLKYNLITIRHDNNITATTIAERLGITPADLPTIEGNDATPTLDQLNRYAQALGVRIIDGTITGDTPTCPVCDGIGMARDHTIPACWRCGGVGEELVMGDSCCCRTCNGTGDAYDPCCNCDGEGSVNVGR